MFISRRIGRLVDFEFSDRSRKKNRIFKNCYFWKMTQKQRLSETPTPAAHAKAPIIWMRHPNCIRNLFKLIIRCKTEMNNRRKNFDLFRSKYIDVFQLLDYSKKEVINWNDLKLYLIHLTSS